MKKVLIVSPVYNDWGCIPMLKQSISNALDKNYYTYELVLVNDGSQQTVPEDLLTPEVIIIDLVRNLGHQKAITIGLAWVAENRQADVVIVMDSDGEDRPEDIPILLNAWEKSPDELWFAQRRKRQESKMFKFLYFFYKRVFKFLTGYVITFGNYVTIPMEKLKRLVYVSEIWNHFPGGIIRSKLTYSSVPIDRGNRYNGQSKMNMVALIQHGLSSITVNLDVVAVRMLIFSFVLIIASLILLFILMMIRLFSDKAIPGWTSSVGIGIVIIVLLAFFFSLLLTFTILNGRIQPTFIPARDYKIYIYRVLNTYQ